jgi:hypothetical protein
MSQKDNVLRLYFNRVTGLFGNLLDPDTGGRFIYYVSGNFYHTQSQTTAVVNTAYASSFDTEGENNGLTVANDSEISFAYGGIYFVSATLQVDTSASATDTITVWFRKNGTDDIPDSVVRDTVETLQAITISTNINIAEGDYLEVMWAATSTDISLATTGASAPYPLIPSASVSAMFVSNN